MARTFVIDGRTFSDLGGFYEAAGNALAPGRAWGKNLDAFNDLLCWPLADDPEPYILLWKNSELSRKQLSHAETARCLEARLRECHPENRGSIAGELKAAQRGEGPTVFDELVEIIRLHPDWLRLRLE
jgi:RNAse (barnase) inhibitor barstar